MALDRINAAKAGSWVAALPKRLSISCVMMSERTPFPYQSFNLPRPGAEVILVEQVRHLDGQTTARLPRAMAARASAGRLDDDVPGMLRRELDHLVVLALDDAASRQSLTMSLPGA